MLAFQHAGPDHLTLYALNPPWMVQFRSPSGVSSKSISQKTIRPPAYMTSRLILCSVVNVVRQSRAEAEDVSAESDAKVITLRRYPFGRMGAIAERKSMKLALSARKMIGRRHGQAQSEAKRVRAETWDGAFWLLPSWNALPLVDRRSPMRDAVPRPARRVHSPAQAWMSQCTFLCGEYLLTVIPDELLWSTFEERYPRSVDDILRAVQAWSAQYGEAPTVTDRSEAT